MTARAMEPDAVETLLQDSWFRAQGLGPGTILTLHPDDEMSRVDLLKVTPERRRMFYMRTGYEAARVLENVLAAAGRPLAELPSLLDFACGYGRPMRFLRRVLPPERIFASDVVKPAVAFVGQTFGVHAFESATEPEDIRFPRRFSAICVFSLFSHLPLRTFETFLTTLYECLEPDGLLVFTTLTPADLPEAERDPSGFTYRMESGIPHLDVEDYGTTYAGPEVVRGICNRLGIRHHWTLERELWRIQDVHVVARRDFPGLAQWNQAPIGRGAILRATLDAAGNARAEGYVRTPRLESPVRDVEIRIDGTRAVPCAFRAHPLTLPEKDGGARFQQTDWFVEGPAPELLTGVHAIAGVVTLKNGAQSCFDVVPLART